MDKIEILSPENRVLCTFTSKKCLPNLQIAEGMVNARLNFRVNGKKCSAKAFLSLCENENSKNSSSKSSKNSKKSSEKK